MSIRKPRIEQKAANQINLYNLWFSTTIHPLWRELLMIQHGGRWTKKDGTIAGNGNLFHYKEAIRLAWPHIDQHRWFDVFAENWLIYKYVAVLGPKSSGKTCDAAVFHLIDYYAFPNCTTTVVCSDTKENLEDRIWGEIKKLHRIAKADYAWLPGQLIEGRTRIVTDNRDEHTEGRDFRNGMVGVSCKKGNAVVGISAFVGRKNKRVRFCADELSLLPMSFIDATASQANPEVKVTGMGNPATTTDALGALAEPDVTLGGWDSGIDQSPKTKTWKTRWPNGIAIQLPGSDCPNMDVPEDAPVPFPYLMTRKQMEEDAKIWGKEDWHYTMFNEGRMPRGQGSRRVLTRQLCLKNHAMDEAIWASVNRTRIASLDAAYRAVGGDRCVFAIFEFGPEGNIAALPESEFTVSQQVNSESRQVLFSLKEISIIPIEGNDFESPEDQIVMYVKKACETNSIAPRNFFFDSGMRTSLVTAFSRLWSVDVNPIDCGGRPSERKVSENIDVLACDYYSKKITELWYSWRLIVEAGQFRGMTEDVMKEGCQREWMTVGGNKIEVETKADMKLKTGRSPDLADCVVIGIEGARQRGFHIKRMVNEEYVETDTRWKDELRRKALAITKKYQLNYAA